MLESVREMVDGPALEKPLTGARASAEEDASRKLVGQLVCVRVVPLPNVLFAAKTKNRINNLENMSDYQFARINATSK